MRFFASLRMTETCDIFFLIIRLYLINRENQKIHEKMKKGYQKDKKSIFSIEYL